MDGHFHLLSLSTMAFDEATFCSLLTPTGRTREMAPGTRGCRKRPVPNLPRHAREGEV
jgi:hypothetical protein